MTSRRFLLLAATLATSSILGAACGGGAKNGGTGGSSSGGTSNGGVGAEGGSGGGISFTGGKSGTGGVRLDCAAPAEACKTGTDCCSNNCDGEKCVANLGMCGQEGVPCGDASECCTVACIDGGCSGTQCVGDGDACDDDEECCGGLCTDGKCADVNGSISICKSGGNTCDADGDCCSKLCTGGHCSLGSSYCLQLYDRCTNDDQCCQGTCTIADGKTIGYCSIQPTTGTGCTNKKLAGEVCEGNCTDCCSRACAPYAESGKRICQPASGCKPEGEICQDDLDCCGGDETANLPGAGNGTCDKADGALVGRCKVTSCSPQGDICKYPASTATTDDEKAYVEFCGSGSTASNNCCGFLGNSSNCRTDVLNIPRCDSIDDCRLEGEACASSGDCCGGLPCVQNESGSFVCYDPPGDGDCVPGGGPCTTDGDCCVGSLCNREPGESTGTCGVNTGGEGGAPGTGGSLGTGGTTSCASYGQSCETASDCCSGVPCDTSIHVCRYIIK